jgi:hypothetical protein
MNMEEGNAKTQRKMEDYEQLPDRIHPLKRAQLQHLVG